MSFFNCPSVSHIDGKLTVRQARLKLTKTAADTLNSAFGLDGMFTGGFPIGTALIGGRFRDYDSPLRISRAAPEYTLAPTMTRTQAVPEERQQVSLLLIEDHRDIAESIVDFLEPHGFAVDYAADGITGLHLAVTNSYDVIVLDVMLPGIDGLTVCRKIREEARRETPILMLTARDTLEDKITGLDAGADDYLVKPFEIRELQARLRSMVRRHRGAITRETHTVGDLTIDLATLKVTRAGRALSLTPIGFRLLTVLARASPRVVSRRDLEREVWGEMPPDSDALRSHLYNLRKAIDRPFDRPLLHTVAAAGYRLADDDGS